MRFMPVVLGASALSILAWGLPVSPSAAAVADGSWALTGSLSAPARSTTNVTATLSGSLEVSSGALTQAACTDPSAPAQGQVQLVNSSSGAFTALSGSGVDVTAAGTTSVSATATVAPGSYELVLRLRCGGSGSFSRSVSASPPVTVSIATLSSSRPITRACRPTTPESACTASSTNVTGVPVGLSVTLGAAVRQTWSDGVVTDGPLAGSQRLESAAVDSATWTTTNPSTCAVTVTLSASRQFRCVSGSGTHDPVTVTAMTPTTTVTLGTPTVTPASSVRGESITLAAPVSMVYPDSSSWPAPTDVQYRIEFLAASSDRWVQIAGPFTLESRGNVNRPMTMPGTGKLRIVSGSVASTPVDLVEATPQETYTWSEVSFPTSVPTRGMLSASARVRQTWSDGVSRNVADGTAIEVQFATAYSTLDPDLQWRTVSTATSGGGAVSIRVAPLTSGFWRLKLGSSMTTPAFVQLVGSTPLAWSATFVPRANEKPFVGTASRYDVSMSLGGYAGGSWLEAWVVLGNVSSRLGSFSGSGTVSDSYSVNAPDTPGPHVPRIELRDAGGFVLATATAAPVVIDGNTSVTPTVTFPDKQYSKGDSVTVEAKLTATTYLGVPSELDWSGRVELQELRGTSWEAITYKDNASGKVVSLTFNVGETGQKLRVFSVERQLASAVFEPKIVSPTGVYQILAANAPTRVEKGKSVSLSAAVQEEFTDGSFLPVKTAMTVALEHLVGSTWQNVTSVVTNRGQVTASFTPVSSGRYRLVVAGTPYGQEWSLYVATPGSLNIRLPSKPRYGADARVWIQVVADDGPAWTGSESVSIQHLAKGTTTWSTVASAIVTKGSPAAVTIPSPRAGTYRALLDSTGLTAELNLLRPTGVYSFDGPYPSQFRAQPGRSVTFSAAISAGYTDGSTQPIGFRRIALVFSDGVSQRVVKVIRNGGSEVSASVIPTQSGEYFFLLPDGTRSPSSRVTLVNPELEVTWPTEVVVDEGIKVSVTVIADDGQAWRGSSWIQLQYRASSSSRWTVRDSGTVRNGSTLTLVARDPKPGEYRVYFDDYDLQESVTYASESGDGTTASRMARLALEVL